MEWVEHYDNPQASTAYNRTNSKSMTADGEFQEQIMSAKVRNL